MLAVGQRHTAQYGGDGYVFERPLGMVWFHELLSEQLAQVQKHVSFSSFFCVCVCVSTCLCKCHSIMYMNI